MVEPEPCWKVGKKDVEQRTNSSHSVSVSLCSCGLFQNFLTLSAARPAWLGGVPSQCHSCTPIRGSGHDPSSEVLLPHQEVNHHQQPVCVLQGRSAPVVRVTGLRSQSPAVSQRGVSVQVFLSYLGLLFRCMYCLCIMMSVIYFLMVQQLQMNTCTHTYMKKG